MPKRQHRFAWREKIVRLSAVSVILPSRRKLACNHDDVASTGTRETTRKPRKVGTLAYHRINRRPGAALPTRRRTAPTSRRRRRRLGDRATYRPLLFFVGGGRWRKVDRLIDANRHGGQRDIEMLKDLSCRFPTTFLLATGSLYRATSVCFCRSVVAVLLVRLWSIWSKFDACVQAL